MNAEEHVKRGSECFKQDDYDQAITHFREALRLDPNIKAAKNGLVNSYYNRGTTYFEKGDNNRAIADLSEAIKLDPDDIDFYRARGYMYKTIGNRDGVIKDFGKAIEIDKDDASNYFPRAEIYRELGKEARESGNDKDGSKFLEYTNKAIKDFDYGLNEAKKGLTGENAEQLTELYKKQLELLTKELGSRTKVYDALNNDSN